MPNWVSNTLNIYGDEETIAQIKTDVANGDRVLDFNKIIPMPPHSDTFYAEGALGPAEEEKYGKNNWYNWSIANWGTKWNSSDAVLSEDESDHLRYCFETAWNPAAPIAKAIAEKYGVRVDLIYVDEDIGINCGVVELDKYGNCTHSESYNDNVDEGLKFIARYYGNEYLEDRGLTQNSDGDWRYVL